MYGLTRATVTLLSAAVAGFLIWIATQVGDSSNGDYWATYGLIAGAGLVMALSQLLGGWTKCGLPRMSINVFLWAFVPAAIAVLWIVVFHQPDHGLAATTSAHGRTTSASIGSSRTLRSTSACSRSASGSSSGTRSTRPAPQP